ncbi:DUF4126 domain-containing protein [Tibeticola sp.]|uniref:DUF4126 domain-containing protein n=1 Tax=Tibeticola sp. TaxID=2005368 RepID=UPI0025D4A476|nr:DUF4126 domain-containing protein [Tibeticola sp.]
MGPDLVQWLHRLGLHLGAPVRAPEGPAVDLSGSALDLPSLLALAAALGWASGFRLYAAVFLVGLAGQMGWILLPPGLGVLQHPALLIVSGALLLLEFMADKVPGVDSLWDLANSLIRIPAGAALAAAALGGDGAVAATLGALFGGALAATSQAAKTTSRAAINTSPEPFSNVAASLFEDGAVVFVLWLATTHPWAFGAFLVVAVLMAVGITLVLFRFLRGALRRLAAWFSSVPKGS